jgi:hypothetical protein
VKQLLLRAVRAAAPALPELQLALTALTAALSSAEQASRKLFWKACCTAVRLREAASAERREEALRPALLGCARARHMDCRPSKPCPPPSATA